MELAYHITAELRSALIPVGDLRRQVETLREGEALARALGDRRRLARTLAQTVYTVGALGDHARAIEAGEQGRALAEEVGDLSAMVVADAMLGRAYYALGQYSKVIDAATRAFGALPGELAYRRSGSGLLQSVGARVWTAMALAEQGRFVHANSLSDEARRIAETDRGTHERVWSHFGGGRVCLVQGRLDRAVELLASVLPLARGDLGVYVSRIASTLGSAHLLAGRTAEALALLEEAAEHGKSIGFMHGHSLVLTLLGEGYLVADRLDDATRRASEALELARKHGERGWEAWTLRLLGKIAAGRDPAEAEARYGEALALAEELGMRPLQTHCQLGLGCVRRDRADVAAALDLYRAMGMTFWLERAEAELAVLMT
jgi:tetratricopeptide (TPR) repeat protein